MSSLICGIFKASNFLERESRGVVTRAWGKARWERLAKVWGR